MTEAFLDDLQVSATGEQPRGVRVAKIMKMWQVRQVGSLAGWTPDHAPEPVAANVLVLVC